MKGGPYPGLFLFTIAARVVRPVLQRATGRTEYIGPMVGLIWYSEHPGIKNSYTLTDKYTSLRTGATLHGYRMSS